MSCRIIGRKIELVFIDFIMDMLNKEGVNIVKAEYIKTKKNNQVVNFYDDLGFIILSTNEPDKFYQIQMSDYNFHEIKYIEIRNGK